MGDDEEESKLNDTAGYSIVSKIRKGKEIWYKTRVKLEW